jgi:hypothetical protein
VVVLLSLFFIIFGEREERERERERERDITSYTSEYWYNVRNNYLSMLLLKQFLGVVV